MKAIKDCEWTVAIRDYLSNRKPRYYFSAETFDNNGLLFSFKSRNDYVFRKGAVKNWKKFAELNGITNYKIEK